MLGLWLASEHRKEDWYIGGALHELAKLFQCVRLPSTTTRIPRSLIEYRKFKASELRVLLLFGHVIFKRFLKEKYYEHLVQLVVAMHIAENRNISPDDRVKMKRLCHSFVLSFPRLYTERHCVQVVHSVVHIPETVEDFGPLTNYTTFNFESDLGKEKSIAVSDFCPSVMNTLTFRSACENNQRIAQSGTRNY